MASERCCGFAGAPLGGSHRVLRRGRTAVCMVERTSGDGWVRKVPLLSGRAVFAEYVQWSVSETMETPRNALEAAVWRKSVEADYAREKLPFMSLRARVMAQCKTQGTKKDELIAACAPGARNTAVMALEIRQRAGQEEGTLEKEARSAVEGGDYAALWVAGREHEVSGEKATTFDGAETDLMWRAGDWTSVARVRRAVAAALPVISADIVAHPYQIFRARDLGADAVVVMLAVFSLKDMAYQLKAIRSLGMGAVLEVHTEEEYRIATSGPLDGLFDVLLVALRDIHSDSLSVKTTSETMEKLTVVAPSFDSVKVPILLLVSDGGETDVVMPPGVAGLVASQA